MNKIDQYTYDQKWGWTYSRQKIKMETNHIVDDLWEDVVFTPDYNMEPAFYNLQSDEELREWGDID